jgi:hypothetical protein
VPGAGDDPNPFFVQVSAGEMHTCALSARGNVYCWGSNAGFQLGRQGSSDPQVTPSANKYSWVSAGTHHSCAVTTAGNLDCWGSNDFEQLHPGSTLITLDEPTDVRGFHPGLVGAVTRVAANEWNTCANSVMGGVVCWGSGVAGDWQVTKADAADVELGFILPSRLIGMWDEVCAIASDRVSCGMPQAQLSQVPGSARGFIDSTVGGGHYCGVMANGTAFCWGQDNLLGQMGDGSNTSHAFPERVQGP